MTYDPLPHLTTVKNHGIAVLRSAFGRTIAELEESFVPYEAYKVARAANLAYGTTTFTKKQRIFRNHCENNNHSWQAIALIDQQARKLDKPTDQWDIRLTLAATKGGYRTILNKAKELVEPRLPKKDPTPRVTIRTKGEDTTGYVTLTQPIDAIRHFVAGLSPYMPKDLPHDQALGAAFAHYVNQPGSNVTYTVNIIVHLPDYLKTIEGKGDDIQLACTDGTLMTGKDFVNLTTNAETFVGLFDPVEGPVNLYRTKRTASTKQRHLLGLETPVCAHPGCSTPAKRCQAHHITAWEQGGETNLNNMTLLCAYHNGKNDDTTHTLNGRMARINGRVGKIPPWTNATPQFNDHPTMQRAA